MSRYIDVDNPREIILNCTDYDCDTINFFLQILEDEPDADVVPVKRGKWEDGKCTLCGNEAQYTEGFVCNAPEPILSDFCPNCGADMYGEDKA